MIYLILAAFSILNSHILPENNLQILKIKDHNYNRGGISLDDLNILEKILNAEKKNYCIGLSFENSPRNTLIENELATSCRKQVNNEIKKRNLFFILSGLSAASFFCISSIVENCNSELEYNKQIDYIREATHLSAVVNFIFAARHGINEVIRKNGINKRYYISPFPNLKENFLKRFR